MWADSEGPAQSTVMKHVPGIRWKRVDETKGELDAFWEAVVAMWNGVGETDKDANGIKHLEKPLGPLVD